MIRGGKRRMPAAATAGYQIRSLKLPSSTEPPPGAVNRRTSRGRPVISADMPSRMCGGTGTTRWDFLDFGQCLRPFLVITSTTWILPRSQSTRWPCSPYSSPGRRPTSVPSSIRVRQCGPISPAAMNSASASSCSRKSTSCGRMVGSSSPANGFTITIGGVSFMARL